MPGRNDKDAPESNTDFPEVIAHYRILKKLGKGGMGEVFLAEDTKQHGRKVALKVLPPEVTKDNDRAIKQLNKAFESRHPGLVLIRIEPIFDGLRSDDRFKQLVNRFEPIP
ncbi:MAG TPA: hypothetical protein DCK93_00240 [Blastocatellia bacterium]|jgi:serine/threonine protein kinase|nr:hypothetical protein [Blastocatellia bacterium]